MVTTTVEGLGQWRWLMWNWLLQLSFSIHEFLATCQDYPYVMADSLLDVLTKGGHSRTLQELETVRLLLKKHGNLSLASSVSHSVLWNHGIKQHTVWIHSLENSPWCSRGQGTGKRSSAAKVYEGQRVVIISTPRDGGLQQWSFQPGERQLCALTKKHMPMGLKLSQLQW